MDNIAGNAVQRTGVIESVDYGRTWVARRQRQFAVIPVGYAVGYSQCLGNRCRVLIHGRSVSIVGREWTNSVMADATDKIFVEIGDDVVPNKGVGDFRVELDEGAFLSQTVNSGFLTRLPSEIPRSVA